MKQSLKPTRHPSTPVVNIATVVLLSFVSIGIVGGSFFLRTAFSSNQASEMITDTSRYQHIHNQLWSNKTQVQHFPANIPADASGVRVVYSPGFLQGGHFFQLRLKQSPQKIHKLLVKYRAIAKHKYKGGDTNDHSKQANGVPTTFFYTSDSQEQSFPSSYEILVLGAHERGNRDFKWNHGDSYGVAVNISTSEIIYWAEEW